MLMEFLRWFGFWPEYNCFNGSETIVLESDFSDRSEIDYLCEQDD